MLTKPRLSSSSSLSLSSSLLIVGTSMKASSMLFAGESTRPRSMLMGAAMGTCTSCQLQPGPPRRTPTRVTDGGAHESTSTVILLPYDPSAPSLTPDKEKEPFIWGQERILMSTVSCSSALYFLPDYVIQ
ncbi:hypothetical protein STCU_11723 [Strigomonas culicis]|uniref:Uncharacterized protein n=1 Tax=Strigomonas culicis TaxID=28005 RepID=S9UMB0_9TRYP|nr:hypothetical protein STCU_11723 [Strigomonas culicis]|eukprot:EPY15846.1 hypothetical protein STCU_11723 [Strigomonas culicis]